MQNLRISKILLTLCLCAVPVGAIYAADWKPVERPLTTRWTSQVSPENALPEYPRTQMVRPEWQNLNGLWDFALVGKDDKQPEKYEQKILVPYPVESALSGLGTKVEPRRRMWYRRTFEVPKEWKNKRVLLHFGAVDWDTVVYVNGKEIGSHRGGYDGFSFDITEALKQDKAEEIVLSVWDPTPEGGQPVGKQSLNPGGIVYTATSGVWQTVWLEPVPTTYIKGFRLMPDVDKGSLGVSLQTEGKAEGTTVKLEALDGKKSVAKADGKPAGEISLPIAEAKLWTPDSPFLYDLKITLLDSNGKKLDEAQSYFAMRKISIGPDEKGITRLLLNGKFVFQVGPLDQGFWPDGLYTAPVDEALRYDVEMTKKYGFNMARKHVKVEPDRWYYWCDKLGLMVWQDMPSAGNSNAEQRKQFELELENVINDRYNHPSIIMWVPFNEGWGQYDTPRIVEQIKKWDPTRLVNNASGWSDTNCGDVLDHHSYPSPGRPHPEAKRAAVDGEFGGLGLNYPEHTWNQSGWGYDRFQDIRELNDKYEQLMDVLLGLIDDPGISAGVYTQTSDIETENNGLMTYDREIAKVSPEISAAALQGYSAPKRVGSLDKFIDSIRIEFKSPRTDAKMRYTTDGSEPSEKSSLYEDPVTITETSTIKVRAFWPNGKASTSRTYTITKVSATPAKAPASLPVLKPGLKVSYYEGNWDKLPDFSALTPKKSSVAKKIDMAPAERNDAFGLKFEGWIKLPKMGVYVFHAISDDGSRLSIGDEVVVNNDGVHGVKDEQNSIALEAGTYPISLVFFQGFGGRDLRVDYEGPEINRQEIPAEVLFHVEDPGK